MKGRKPMEGRKPEIKPPKFLTDLYRDLRDQRLLPLVILLLVAIPVVPFLLSDPTPTFVPPADDEGLSATIGDTSLMVVSAPAGLRRHGERFADRTPRDPFVDPNAPEQTAESAGSGAQGSAAGAGTGSGTDLDDDTADLDLVPPPSSSGIGGGGTGSYDGGSSRYTEPGGSGGGGSSTDSDSLTLYRMMTTVRFGKAGSGLLHTFEDINRMRGLPRVEPIAVFIGASDDGSRAIFSISADASLVTGQGSCSSGRPKNCQFLTLRPGKAANIRDARRNVVWRLAVSSIKLVESEIKVESEAKKGSGTSKGATDRGPVAEPTDPEVIEAASLSEVIGLYLLK